MYAERMNAGGLAAVAALLLGVAQPALSAPGEVPLAARQVRKIALGPISPQPASGPMTFQYRLARPAMVSLTICDPNGWVVQTLVDDAVAAGDQAVEWDGCDFAGRAARDEAFLIVLRADGQVVNRPFILIRPIDMRRASRS